MTVVICPGVHDAQLTQEFLGEMGLGDRAADGTVLVFPSQEQPAYSAWHVLEFVQGKLSPHSQPELLFIGFSAGVVGAMGAAWGWQQQGGAVKALIAIDGWGVPLFGVSVHRISHDAFTHWSSMLLGGSEAESFYCEPPIDHLDAWRSPQSALGVRVSPTGQLGCQPTTLASFITELLHRYDEG